MSEEKKIYLLREVAEFDFKPEIDTDGKGRKSKWGNMLVKGILQRANTLNQNGRIYPKDILSREIELYRKLISERRAMGCLDHSDSTVVDLQSTSHVITDIWWEGDVVWGEVEILEKMDQGRQLKALFDDGIKVGISSRAVGSVKQQNGHSIVQEDLQLICWDFVSEPSTPGAFMMQEARLLRPHELKTFFKKSDKINEIADQLLGFKK